ncbi:MAG: DUF58 domain-containing protein [Gammaproteobacteria bacterium]
MRPYPRKARAPLPAARTGEGVGVTLEELALLHGEAVRFAPQTPDVVAGLFPGIYRSLSRGRGLEFEEVRHYLPGDDFRTIDWRVTARTGHLYTKVFREERERPVLLALDASTSMRFGSRRAYLWVAAAQSLAVIAWLAADNHDRVGGVLFGCGTGIRETRPILGSAGPLRLFRLWEGAGGEPPLAAGSGLVEALLRIRHHARHGALAIVASDFRGWSDEAQRHAAKIAAHNDLVLLHVTDPLERQLPAAGWLGFSDGREIIALDTRDRDLRAGVSQEIRERHQRLQRFCDGHRIRLLALDNQLEPADALLQALGRPAAIREKRP